MALLTMRRVFEVEQPFEISADVGTVSVNARASARPWVMVVVSVVIGHTSHGVSRILTTQ